MRESGVLMHISSLPGPYGIGSMGREAFAFVDFLKRAGQSCWQLLPLNPTGYGNSPYQSCSTFAGNHYLIDLSDLVRRGLLRAEEAEAVDWGSRADWVDFGGLYANRRNVLRIAYGRFSGGAAFDDFCARNADWLPEYALFQALKDENGGKPWYEWDDALKLRDPAALAAARTRLAGEIRFSSFVQYLFFTQWEALHAYARKNGIEILGDVPIYVPLDSVDVWSRPELFQLDETRTPVVVAGCPPDAFTADGQLWGNPIYRWDEMAKDGYAWWIRRLEAAGHWYDRIRLDHFRGFEAYWAIPYGDKTARGGKWVKGPGMALIGAIRRALPQLPLIAEDLGFLTQEVLDLRDASGYPGMKVLGFAFDSREPNDYLPYAYGENTVCYTGTHDNMTARQWFDTAPAESVAYAAAYMALEKREDYTWGMIRTAMASPSRLCIVPIQDYLDLGADARMNLPGTLSDANWTWRVQPGALDSALAKRIHSMTALYGRLGKQK